MNVVETNIKLEKIITLQEKTLQEIRTMELKIDSIERRLENNEREAYDIKIECAKNSKSLTYQWWIITFIWFLLIVIFANLW